MEEHFDELVDFAEIHDFVDTPIKNYPSGMKARLGFSVATMVKPEILIVDEVLAVGDYKFQRHVCVSFLMAAQRFCSCHTALNKSENSVTTQYGSTTVRRV